jgi:cytochrome c556
MRRRVVILSTLGAAVLLAAGSAFAAGMADAVTSRQAQFKTLGANFKALNDEIRKGDPDMKKIRASAAVVRKASLEIPRWFPRGSGAEAGVKTKVLPSAWSDAAGFAQSSKDFAAEAAKLQALAAGDDADDLRAQAKTVAQTCGTCHTKYREK